MSDLSHVSEKFRNIAMLPDAKERLLFLEEDRWVGYLRANETIEHLYGLMHIPKRSRMPNALIVSEPNNGKTSLINRFKILYGEGYVDENNNAVKPVIAVQAPASPDEKALYINILDHFWAPYRERDSTLKLRNQVIHFLRISHVRLLIIDEMNSLLGGSAMKQRQVMNAIKYLCNEASIPIVGFGTREAVRVLHTDPQHASRFEVITLPLWTLDSNFQKLLVNFEKILPLRKPSFLAEPEMARLLHAKSGGNLGNLHTILRESAKVAIKSGQEMISKELIEQQKWTRLTQGVRETSI